MGVKHQLARMVFPLFKRITQSPEIMSLDETMEHLLNGYSIARFGDGELQAITQNIDNSFQSSSDSLSVAIACALQRKRSKLLVAIAQPIALNFEGMTEQAKDYWQPLLLKNWYAWRSALDTHSIYGNAMVTRPFFDYRGRHTSQQTGDIFDQFKTLWNSRRVLIVEGQYSRFGVGDDLLNSARDVRRIIAPAENAFEKYNEIKESIDRCLSTNQFDLVLLSLGQTASILVADSYNNDVQMIDIGHLDIEYNWYLDSSESKIGIAGKWVNEATPHFVEFVDKNLLDEYRNQIISIVS